MHGLGYRHYHPDTQRKFSEFAPGGPIPGLVCALVVSVETAKGPPPRHFAERLSTESTRGGWLAVEAVRSEPVSESKFAANREINREFRRIRALQSTPSSANRLILLPFLSKYAQSSAIKNREFKSQEQGMFG
jgi:hypothetical protein